MYTGSHSSELRVQECIHCSYNNQDPHPTRYKL